MANLLQALIIWAAAGALGLAAAPFSHQVHLEQRIACAVCHAPAAASTKAEDDLLPKAEVCSGCHTGMTVRQAPSDRFVKKFSHAAHSKTLNCQSCHRQSAAALNPGFPAMAFCMGCHNQVDMLESCYKCHLKTQQLKPASHLEETFFSLHSSGKFDTKNAGCAVCHGKNFTCMGCH